MSEVGVEIIKTEETKEVGIKYLNANISNSEFERNPDIVRLCADAGILEYVKPKTGHWFVDERPESDREVICSNCEQPIFKYHKLDFDYRPRYCPNCGAKMEVEE